ncbi:MAG: hypothetical protein JWR85_3591 [Marmoricola sp.]|nr:hypothetical protein [Marmoricola sp.]
MIRRLTTPEEALEVDAIANDPGVRETMFLGMVYPQHDLFWEDVVAEPKNHVLIADGFCAVFCWTSPAVYECHIMALKQARGAAMLDQGRAMLRYMKSVGAACVWGQPSIHNRGAITYIRRMGLVPVGLGNHAVIGDVQYFVTKEL